MEADIIVAVCYLLLVISFLTTVCSLIAIWLINRRDIIMFARTRRLLLPHYVGDVLNDFIMPAKDFPDYCDMIPPRMPDAGEDDLPPESIPL